MAGKGEVVTGFMAGEYALPQEEREFRKAVASAKRQRKAVIDQALKSKNYQLIRSIKEAKAKGQPYSIEASADPAAHNEILKQERIKAGTWRTSPFLTQDSSSPAPTKNKSKKVLSKRAQAKQAQKAAGYDKMSSEEKTQWWANRWADEEPPPGPKGKKAQKRDSLTKSTTPGDKPMAKSKKNAASTTPTDSNSTPPAVAAATAKADDAVKAKSATKKPAAKKPATKKPAAKKPATPKDDSKKPSAITRADGPRNFGANKRGDGGYNDDVKRYSEAMGREKELVGGASKPELKPLTPSDGGAPKDSSTPAQQPAAPAQSQPAKPGFASRIRGMFGGRGKKQAPSAGAPAAPAAPPPALPLPPRPRPPPRPPPRPRPPPPPPPPPSFIQH